jgi:hypothetical protein
VFCPSSVFQASCFKYGLSNEYPSRSYSLLGCFCRLTYPSGISSAHAAISGRLDILMVIAFPVGIFKRYFLPGSGKIFKPCGREFFRGAAVAASHTANPVHSTKEKKIDLVFKIIGATPTHSILDKFNLPIYIYTAKLSIPVLTTTI